MTEWWKHWEEWKESAVCRTDYNYKYNKVTTLSGCCEWPQELDRELCDAFGRNIYCKHHESVLAILSSVVAEWCSNVPNRKQRLPFPKFEYVMMDMLRRYSKVTWRTDLLESPMNMEEIVWSCLQQTDLRLLGIKGRFLWYLLEMENSAMAFRLWRTYCNSRIAWLRALKFKNMRFCSMGRWGAW